MIAMMLATVLCGGALPGLATAERLEVSASVLAGTGISLAGSGGKTFARRSPTFLQAEVGLVHPQLPWLELAPTLMLEIDGRIGFGIAPKLRARLPGKRVRAYGVVAMPLFVVPYTLLGVQAGGGLMVALHRRVGLLAEFTGGAYVWGSDLMPNAALGPFNASLGMRVNF